MTMRRRAFICGCGGGVLTLAGCGGGDSNVGAAPQNQLAAQVRGCGYSASVYRSSYPGCGGPVGTSGNAALDFAFLQEYEFQKSFWVMPQVSFTFLNDCDAPNAYASNDTRAILFGLTMAADLFRRYGSALPLWQVLAHEFGHQIQFALGDFWLQSPTVAPVELEADMFSGYYLLLAKPFLSYNDMYTAAFTAFNIGDFAFNGREHHGTPNQRANAVIVGAQTASLVREGRLFSTYPAIRGVFAHEVARILNTVL